jgi:hypothetical protein
MRQLGIRLAALALAAFLLLVPIISCSGMSASIWLGSNSYRSHSYRYYAPYAFIESHRFYVYWEFHRSYVRYRGDIYYITIHSDGRAYAPYSLVVLLR